MLRYYGPVEMSLTRWVRQDTELGGQRLRRGEQIVALLASANHDDVQFPNPERFDIAREPNRHVAFGTGIHSCLGATLARLEGQVAFATLSVAHAGSCARHPSRLRCVGATPRSCAGWCSYR